MSTERLISDAVIAFVEGDPELEEALLTVKLSYVMAEERWKVVDHGVNIFVVLAIIVLVSSAIV